KTYNYVSNVFLLNELYLYNKLIGNWFYITYVTQNNFKITNKLTNLKKLNLNTKIKNIVNNFFINAINYKKKKELYFQTNTNRLVYNKYKLLKQLLNKTQKYKIKSKLQINLKLFLIKLKKVLFKFNFNDKIKLNKSKK